MRFLYYDHVKTIEKGRRIVAVKTFPLSEEFMGRHFSRRPATPGVILVEAMAQAIGWLAVYSHDFEFSAILSMVEGVKVPHALQPGATAEIHGVIVSTTDRDTLARGRVLVGGEEIASVERIIFAHFRGASKNEIRQRFEYYGGFRGEHFPAEPSPEPSAVPAAGRRVVVTGMGIVTSLGVGAPRNWRRASGGESNGRTDLPPAGNMPGGYPGQIDEEDWLAMVARLPGVSASDPRQKVLALQAAEEAMLQARLVSAVPLGERAGVAIGARNDSLGGELARRYGLGGLNRAVSFASAASTQALGEAYHAIRDGEADLMLAGGADLMAETDKSNPFATPFNEATPLGDKREAIALGEGAGIAVLESEEHALDRGARIYAEIVGFASSSDTRRVLLVALEDAQRTPESIDCLYVRGPLCNANIAAAIRETFGERGNKIAVRSAEPGAGHLIGAGGGPEFVLAALSVFRGKALSREATVRTAVSACLGLGEQNAAVVVAKHEA